MSRKEALASAFHTLKIRPGLSSEAAGQLIEIATDKLSLMAGPHSTTVPAAFSNTSFADADSEKKLISHSARNLAAQIENLHRPTIIALAKAGLTRDRLGAVAEELKVIASLASRAAIDPDNTSAQLGRPARGPIKIIRRIVADTYYRVSGEKPSSAGEFLRLSGLVIEILDLDVKPSGFAKAAYEDFHGEPLSD
ncbi:hypothetical protein [Methylobacterium sp. yr668]|uniref:hypothetical protein n=1 Tax=Methylobacterium sp. yr668 TaxID=1761801 RepID=UPI001114C789|nr:hypothetical protein [Methylobacterium sp. yr668]